MITTKHQWCLHLIDEYIRRIKTLISLPARLLDVGAATGFFLDIARKHGFQVSGVEISAFAAEEGRKKGIDMITGTLHQIPQERSFEVITMFDLIEHVSDPRAEIALSKKLLTKDGLLVINTPDIGSLYARIMGRKWHLIVPPEHLYYFTRTNMKMLLEEEGFKVLSIGTVGKRFTLAYIFKTLYTWQKLSLWKHLSHWFERGKLANVALPVNLYDNMFVIARKV
jgi:2-polyprenyl-3-methyl-5-hydroxy-6-metoxy-1,4-benzoquinol methylase